jgi:hypothetical protein
MSIHIRPGTGLSNGIVKRRIHKDRKIHTACRVMTLLGKNMMHVFDRSDLRRN